MTHAIRFHKAGGPEVLVWEEVKIGKPGAGEARIRHTAVGLNFVDIYNRSGLYPVQLPSGLGGEGTGVVEEIGPGVTNLKPGDRVDLGARAQCVESRSRYAVLGSKLLSDLSGAGRTAGWLYVGAAGSHARARTCR